MPGHNYMVIIIVSKDSNLQFCTLFLACPRNEI